MIRPRHFEIRYCLNDKKQVFVQPDSHMTDADAWYYACLHANIELLYAFIHEQSFDAFRERAQELGVTKVRWEELP
jgi:hypothetical protein